MIDTNQMKIHFDHSAIARDFAIYEIRRDSGNYYQSKIPDFALEECHARACTQTKARKLRVGFLHP